MENTTHSQDQSVTVRRRENQTDNFQNKNVQRSNPLPAQAQVKQQEAEHGNSTVIAPSAIDMTLPKKSWTVAHYKQLADMTQQGMTGEQIMKFCNINRRDALKALLYDAQSKGHACREISWSSGSGSGSRELPQLKADKEGHLRISKIRFERLGFQVSERSSFTLTKCEGGMLLKLLS